MHSAELASACQPPPHSCRKPVRELPPAIRQKPSANCRRGVRTRQAAALRPAAAMAAASTPEQQQEQQRQQTALLDWLVRSQGAVPSCLKVERRFVNDGMGWCLVATADIEPEEVILSVPMTAAISSEGADESRWSTHMAAQLLEKQRQAEVAAAAAAASSSDGGAQPALAASAQPWLDALPAHVDLPWIYWSDAELAELQDADTIAEAQNLQGVYEAACEELGGSYSQQQVGWALSMVHSRSFIEGGNHLWIPGIDMCNHTLSNNATIRCIHSPGSCQGAAALEEVCPPGTAAAQAQEPSRFELVAGEEMICAGQEVTITYGSWPSDVFLLFFGFAPAHNPHDSAVLFYDLFNLVDFKMRQVAAAEAAAAAAASGTGSTGSMPLPLPPLPDGEQGWEQVEEAVLQLEALVGPQEQFFRMVATANGIDTRLLHAAQALLAAGRGSPSGQPLNLAEFLMQRSSQLLAEFPTSLEEDEQLLQQLESQLSSRSADEPAAAAVASAPEGVRLGPWATAVRYRLGKKRVLHATLASIPN